VRETGVCTDMKGGYGKQETGWFMIVVDRLHISSPINHDHRRGGPADRRERCHTLPDALYADGLSALSAWLWPLAKAR
jgi:hypothetical protein